MATRKPRLSLRVTTTALAVVLLLLLTGSMVLMAGAEVKWVTDGIPMTRAAGDDDAPLVVADGSGGAVIVWKSVSMTVGAQRVDADGNLLWGNDGIVVFTGISGTVFGYDVIPDGSGGAFVVCDEAGGKTHGQHIDQNGNLPWGAGGVLMHCGSADSWYPRLCSDGSGGFIAAWEDRLNPSSNYDILAQRVDNTGTAQWNTVVGGGAHVYSGSGDQTNAQVVAGSSGDTIVAWQDDRSGDDYIYAQRMDGAGNQLWNANGVNLGKGGWSDRYMRDIATDGVGGAIVGWEYQARLTTPEEAVKDIESGDRVFASGASSTPVGLLDALFDRAGELRDVLLGSFIIIAPSNKILKEDMQRNILIDNYYASPLDRSFLAEGLMTHTPYHFSRVTYLATEFAGYRKLMIQTGPMDKNGYLNCGLFGNYLDVLDKLDVLYVEVNEQQPKVHGPNFVHISQVDKVVENHHPVFALPPEPVGDIDRAIAENVIDLIEDGSTIQLGIGGTTNAIGELLIQKNHLGCHTEMMGDAYLKLFDAGVLDNSQKNFHKYQMNCYFGLGSQELYDFMDDNPMIYLSPISYNNDPYIVGRNDKLISINTTLEIDITGQCASESFGPIQYTATGGQVDFTRGAWLSKGGKSLMVTSSTTKDKDSGETVSKIVPCLRPGAVVTLTRTDVMYVASEYGVVNLEGKSLRGRAQALIGIAHPDFRGELRRYAREVKYFVLPEHDPFED